MSRRSLVTALTFGFILCVPLAQAWGRGRGGGGGGGRGGFSGGGVSGGPSRSPGGLSGGAGPRPSGFSSSAGRSPAGMSSLSSGVASRGPSGVGGSGRVAGAGTAGTRPAGGAAAMGGQSRNQFSAPSSGQLNSFLGLPSSGAVGGPASGIGARPGVGAGVAGRPGSIGVGAGNIGVGTDLGLGGGRPGFGAGVGGPASGIGVLPGVGAGRAGVGLGGFNPVAASARYTTAAAVRSNYNHWGVYGDGWWANNPGAWFAAGWATGAAWNACTWNSAASYVGYEEAPPVYYDYGNNVTYQDNVVYMNGDQVGTTEEYYEQAIALATSGAKADAPAESDWLPLGVFALTKPDQKESVLSIQLAVNKDGVIRGNYTDTKSDKTQLIQGSVDKQTQRVAFTVGDNKTNIVETGLYNLTKDEAPCLIHIGSEQTEQWLLVRLQAPEASAN